MSLLSSLSKQSKLIVNNWKRSHSSSSIIDGSHFDVMELSTPVKQRKTQFLQNLLLVFTEKRDQARSILSEHQIQFEAISKQKINIAHQFLVEEQKWRAELANAESVRDSSLSTYTYQLLDLNSKFVQAQRDVSFIRSEVGRDSGSQPDRDLGIAFQSIEDQRAKLEIAELQLRDAANKFNFLKEKPQHLVNLSKLFQNAREDYQRASISVNRSKDDVEMFSKEASRIDHMIGVVSQRDQLFNQMFSARFWINLGGIFKSSIRYK